MVQRKWHWQQLSHVTRATDRLQIGVASELNALGIISRSAAPSLRALTLPRKLPHKARNRPALCLQEGSHGTDH
jgi:hypothetical protein